VEESIRQWTAVWGLDSNYSLDDYIKVNLPSLLSLRSSGSGVLLQSFVREYDALPLILPVTASLAGNVGCIFAARLSTAFHVNVSPQNTLEPAALRSRGNLIVMGTLFSISVPIHLAFLGFVQLLGTFTFDIVFLIAYLVTGALSVSIKI
jgi:solute carrier family 41